MTKTQEKSEKSIEFLEEKFKEITTLLRAENNNRTYKKKHAIIISEIRYILNSAHKRLVPDSGPLQW